MNSGDELGRRLRTMRGGGCLQLRTRPAAHGASSNWSRATSQSDARQIDIRRWQSLCLFAIVFSSSPTILRQTTMMTHRSAYYCTHGVYGEQPDWDCSGIHLENSVQFRAQFGEFSEWITNFVSDLTELDKIRWNSEYFCRIPYPYLTSIRWCMHAGYNSFGRASNRSTCICFALIASLIALYISFWCCALSNTVVLREWGGV